VSVMLTSQPNEGWKMRAACDRTVKISENRLCAQDDGAACEVSDGGKPRNGSLSADAVPVAESRSS
jgi:hypothetical protein